MPRRMKCTSVVQNRSMTQAKRRRESIGVFLWQQQEKELANVQPDESKGLKELHNIVVTSEQRNVEEGYCEGPEIIRFKRPHGRISSALRSVARNIRTDIESQRRSNKGRGF